MPTFILFKAGAFLAVTAYILAQVNTYWDDMNDLPFVGQILNTVIEIIKRLAPEANAALEAPWVLYYFLVTLVSCSSIEIAAAIFALGYTLCPCNGWESQQFHYAVWVILVIVQIPSFLLLTFLSLAAAIVSIVAWASNSVAGSSSGLASVALILFFCFAMPVMIIGCVSCCGACSRARQARPRRRRRHRHYHRYSQKSLHEHHQHIIVSPISSSSKVRQHADDNDHRCKDPNCNHYSKLNLAQEDSSTWTTEE